MKLGFAISFIFALTSFAATLQGAVGIPHEGTPTYAPFVDDIVPFTSVAEGESKAWGYDPCNCFPPNPAECASYCASYGYNGGMCISYACYCILY